MTHNQARVLIEALDLFIRICIGQLDRIAETLDNNLRDTLKIDYRALCERFDLLKGEVLGFAPNESYGIPSVKVSDAAKIAYDLEKTLQKHIATAENHDRWSVWHDGNLLHLGSEPVAKAEACKS